MGEPGNEARTGVKPPQLTQLDYRGEVTILLLGCLQKQHASHLRQSTQRMRETIEKAAGRNQHADIAKELQEQLRTECQ